jgi:hypothetical protein
MSPNENLPRPWATAIDSQGTAWPLRVNLAQAIILRQLLILHINSPIAF